VSVFLHLALVSREVKGPAETEEEALEPMIAYFSIEKLPRRL
jgi:hypothetical protein